MSDGLILKQWPRRAFRDERGWLLKTWQAGIGDDSPEIVESYVTLSHEGAERGHHYHPEATEWFTVLQGEAELEARAIATGDRVRLRLSAESPTTVEVPPGVAHCLRAIGGPMLLLVLTDRLYDPADTVSWRLRWE